MKKRICYLLVLAVLILEASFQSYNIVAAEEDIKGQQTKENVESAETREKEETDKDTEIQEAEDSDENAKAREKEETDKNTETQDTEETDNSVKPQGTENTVENTSIQMTEKNNESAETNSDTSSPLVTLINEKTVISHGKDGEDIYSDGEFCFEISDDSGTNDLNICIKGLDSSVNISEAISRCDDGESIKYTIKLPDNVYSGDLYLSVSDKTGNETKYRFFPAERNIVDTCKPIIKAEILEGSDKRSYAGGPTNQQLEIRVSAEAVSGIESFEVAFVPEGDDTGTADSPEWEAVTLENNMYSLIIGEQLDRITGFDKNAATDELAITAQNDTSEASETEVTATVQTPSQLKLSIKKGTYYFRAKSYAGFENEEETRINQQQRNIKIKRAATDKKPDKSGWYNINTGAPKIWVDTAQSAELADDDCGYELTLHMAVYRDATDGAKQEIYTAQNTVAVKNGTSLEPPQITEKVIEPYEISDDGIYTVYVWGNDVAGNYSKTQKYIINADYTAPESLAITVGGENITNDKNDTSVRYVRFFDSETGVEITGYDALSLIDDSRTTLTIKKSGAFDETIEGKNSITVPTGHRYYVEARMYDNAGNMSTACSNGFVVDNQAPGGKNGAELTIIPKGANENGFFNDDFELELYIKDNPDGGSNAALKDVSYILSSGNGKSETRQLISFDAVNATDSQLDENAVCEDVLKIKASDYESNDTLIELTAIDNAGNTSTAKKQLKIDTTAPQIELEFDGGEPQNGIYYNKARTATVTIREKNFDVDGVSFEITKDGSSIKDLVPTADQWTSDADTHIAKIVFAQDGAYTINIKCIDMADNESVYDNADYFVIDTTPPEISVTYDKEAHSEGWYNTNLTAEIKIVERNFKAEDFKLTAQPAMMTAPWKNDKDVHTTQIMFEADGEYAYTASYMDLAGNRAMTSIQEHFVIDTQLPEIIISGVQDNSANSGEVTPLISITDTYIDGTSVTIAMTDGLGREIELQSSIAQLEQGFLYRLTNVSTQPDSVYHIKVSASDMSGNQSITEIRFSLNRLGSTYDITDAAQIISQMYNKYENLYDIKLVETNIDEVEQFNIYMNRNGEMIKSVRTDKKPKRFGKNKLYYTMNCHGSPELGYTYEYIIYKENFEKEGSYKLTFGSVDRAGNHVNNTLDDKEAQISFIVDDTPPVVYIDGVKTDTPYKADTLLANVYITDNFKLDTAELYLETDDNKRVKTWDYMELVRNVQNPDKGATLDIPEYNEGQVLLFCVKDCAGNEVITLADNHALPKETLITEGDVAKSSEPAETQNQPQDAKGRGAAAAVGILIFTFTFGTGLAVFSRRKNL